SPHHRSTSRDEQCYADKPNTTLECPDKNLLGRYSFTASTPAAGALRPLRDPETPELDDDEDGTG
ncbi:hypothetical protein ACFCZ1_27085, partial [Streptomyces sp. NPDC056224]|uniref:hypothetical protein n=1 Tax=Streptomyces sp. NPDC056224 TaxID=3345750 RepID=UPI0035E0C404